MEKKAREVCAAAHHYTLPKDKTHPWVAFKDIVFPCMHAARSNILPFLPLPFLLPPPI